MVHVINNVANYSLVSRNLTNSRTTSDGFTVDEILTIRSITNATANVAKNMTDYTIVLRDNLSKWKYKTVQWNIVATRYDYNGSYLNPYVTSPVDRFISLTGEVYFKSNKINVLIWQFDF